LVWYQSNAAEASMPEERYLQTIATKRFQWTWHNVNPVTAAVGNSPPFWNESPTDLDNVIIILIKSRYWSRQLANISDHVTWS
jgi:hypothetical protein